MTKDFGLWPGAGEERFAPPSRTSRATTPQTRRFVSKYGLSRCLIGILIASLTIALAEVRAVDTNAVLDAWFSAQSGLRTWSADFLQSRSLKTLTQPLLSTGHVWFAAPDRFRWEIGRPPRTVALRHSDEMIVAYPLLKRAERYSLAANAPGEWRDAMSLLQAGFPRNGPEFKAQFDILSLQETNGVWALALRPRSAFARQVLPELGVSLAAKDFSLLGTELVFVDGSRMRNTFMNAVLNEPVDEGLLGWKPPADFKVTEPLKK